MAAGARQAFAKVTYIKAGNSGQNRSAPVMAEYNKGFTYTDPATGESDTISITFVNTDLRWLDSWLPEKGDKITAKIIQKNWDTGGGSGIFSCGKFCLDDLCFSGPTLTCTIGGVSVPEGNSFRSTERNKIWKEVTLKEVGAEIANKYHLLYDYSGDVITLGTVEQNEESDSGFLSRICQEHDMAIKIYYGKIIIYDKGVYEARPPVTTIYARDMQDWSYNTTLTGTYTGAMIKYTSGADDKELVCAVGSGSRILNLNEKVESLKEAQIKACARVNAENERAETMSVTIMADTRITAGSNIEIEGLCRIDGKYFVDKVTHQIEAEGAYTMALELHKCQRRISEASVMQIADGILTAVKTKQSPEQTQPITLAVGDKVIVNGPAYWGGNGGRANQCSNMTMYITGILSGSYQYRYGVARRRGGTRYGWCAEGSLTKA